jgi:hypothetical protein
VSFLANFVEQVGYQIIIFYHLLPRNGWTNGGGKSHLRYHVEGCFEEEFENVGRMFASCGVCIQSGNTFYNQGKVYGFNPHAPIDILPLPTSERIHSDAKECADFILQMHETTMNNIEKMNEKYRIAGRKGRKEVKHELGDLVWLHLRKDRFPDLRKSKLMPRADGPFNIIEKINDNAYKLELPPEFGVSPTFNISDLKPYLGEEDTLELRTTLIQEGEDDEDITHLDAHNTSPLDIQDPITRARARQLNIEVSSCLSTSTYDL